MSNDKVLIVIPILDSPMDLFSIIDSLYCNDYREILLIDDGTANGLNNIPEEYSSVKYIGHEKSLGYGAVLITAFKYSRDFAYESLIIIDEDSGDIPGDIKQILENINYGYDIVNCSRILENYDHDSIADGIIQLSSIIAEHLNSETGLDLTDPLSGIKGFRVKALENMELTEFTHNALIQTWIQAVYYSLEIIEIPSVSPAGFGKEFGLYSNIPEIFVNFINTEKYLYKKGTIN